VTFKDLKRRVTLEEFENQQSRLFGILSDNMHVTVCKKLAKPIYRVSLIASIFITILAATTTISY
jgi:hypothetical protein